MKILLLAQFLPPTLGGEERHVWTLARALASRAHDVTLLGFQTGGTEPAETKAEGVRVIRVRTAASHLPILYSDPTHPHALPLSDPLVSRAIRHELAENRFDIVHAHDWIVNSALGPTAQARVPLVVTFHDYSHICATQRLMEHGKRVCPGPSPARCLSCAASHYGSIKGAITLAANTWSARRRADKVSRFVAVSGAVADAVALPDNVTWQKISGASVEGEVIPNFIPDEIVLDEIPAIPPDAPLLFVGDIRPDKGVHTLLEAYRLLDRPPPLVLAGQRTPETPPFVFAGRPIPAASPPVPARPSTFGSAWSIPENAEILGAVSHDEVLKLFRSARAVIVPSLFADPCPTVVLEAMAAGRPVVAASSGGIVDLVVNGITGLVFPPGDVFALAQAISKLLSDPQAARALGAAGRDRAREFTVTAVVERIERMYAGAIAETKAKAARAG